MGRITELLRHALERADRHARGERLQRGGFQPLLNGVADGAGQTEGEAVVTKAHGADGTTSYAGTAREEDNYTLSPDLPLEGGVNRVFLENEEITTAMQRIARSRSLKASSCSQTQRLVV